MERTEIIEKIKTTISDCFPDMDVSSLEEDSVINTETSIDSMGFVLIICKLEALFAYNLIKWSKRWKGTLFPGSSSTA